MNSAEYRPDIDGLRAVAVGLVVLSHARLVFPGGFVGVDVFFVISGYLITRIILNAEAEGRLSFGAFWMRRARRILPAALVMSAVTLAVGKFVLTQRALGALGESAIAQLVGVSNFLFWIRGGYFDVPPEQTPLLHTWSLGVEEQFYLLFPPLLVLLGRFARRWVGPVIALLVLLSLVASELLVRQQPSTAFFLLPTRLWELGLGALIAVAPGHLLNRLTQFPILGLIGLAMISFASVFYSPNTMFPGLSAILPCLGTAMIIAAPSVGKLSVTRMLSFRPLVYVGRASYSIYLWHWPILAFAGIVVRKYLTIEQSLAVVAVSCVIGILSFEWIEKPFRSRRWLERNRTFLMYTCLFAAVLAKVGMSFQKEQFAPLRSRAMSYRVSDYFSDIPQYSRVLGSGKALGAFGPRIVLWGDSHAAAIEKTVDDLAMESGIGGISFVRPGFAPLSGAWTNTRNLAGRDAQVQWNEEVLEWVCKHRPTDVFLVARWDNKILSSGSETVEGELQDIQSPSSKSDIAFSHALRRTVTRLAEHNIRVWFLEQVPVQSDLGIDDVNKVQGVSRDEYNRQQRAVRDILTKQPLPTFHVIGPGKHWFDNDGLSRKADGSRALYQDDDHLSDRGADVLIKPLLLPIFEQIKRESPQSLSSDP